jgi:SAM-dependent methyltransferase
MTLTNRPRMRRLIERTAYRALRMVGGPSQPPILPPSPSPATPAPEIPVEPIEPTSPQSSDFARELDPGLLAIERSTVSNLLYERLGQQDVAEVERHLAQAPELDLHYAGAPEEWRAFLVLAYGIWLCVPSISEKTGLLPVQPPEEIHAMARGPLAAAGGIYEADLVVDALASVDVVMSTVKSGLDIGCSSGRVVRALAAAYPETRWRGCDPNAPAIEWASENLPGIEFFVNDNAPPLPLPDGSLDLAYAISIWSHFAPELGLRWFEEMHRLIRPGGHLVCTTHGLTSVAYSAAHGRSEEQVKEILDALYRKGSWYAPEFGEEGDWGVVNPDWGTAFLSPEWMLTHLCPRWRVLEFAPGRNQENQDVYVLQRV